MSDEIECKLTAIHDLLLELDEIRDPEISSCGKPGITKEASSSDGRAPWIVTGDVGSIPTWNPSRRGRCLEWPRWILNPYRFPNGMGSSGW